MASQTVDDMDVIEQIDIANGDLIEVLASLVNGNDTRLELLGTGPNRMAAPDPDTAVETTGTIYTSTLIEDGEVVDTIELNDTAVTVNVV